MNKNNNNKIIMNCKAKINLGIDVLGRRENGYHDVRMVMCQVNIFDTVTIELIEEDGIFLSGSDDKMPLDETNLAYRAAKTFFETINSKPKCKIYIEKRIPMGAGMAGGSTDAAGVINGLNILYNSPLSVDERMKIGGRLGADIPFCVMGGCVLAEGIGEKLTKLPDPPTITYLIVKPQQSVSTKWVYEHLDFSKKPKNLNIDNLVLAVKDGSLRDMYKNMGNVLENATIPICPEVSEIKSELLNLGADFSMMSGSGSSVFGMFEDNKVAESAKNEMIKKHKDWEIWLV